MNEQFHEADRQDGRRSRQRALRFAQIMTAPKALALALLAALAVAACDRNLTGGNANAPGSPGTGNAPAVAAPGTTGRGTPDALGLSKATQAGTGTAGGLGGNSGLGLTGSFPSSSTSAAGGSEIAGGSTNSTRNTAVGNR